MLVPVRSVARRAARLRPVLSAVLILVGVVGVARSVGDGWVAVLPLLLVIGGGSGLIGSVLARDRSSAAIDRLAVSRDRITAWTEAGVGVRASRSAGPAYVVASRTGSLCVSGAAGREVVCGLAGFDPASVEAALRGHGWQDPAPPAARGVREVGSPRTTSGEVVEVWVRRSVRRRRATAAGGATLALAVIAVGVVLDRETAGLWPLVSSALAVLVGLVAAFVYVRQFGSEVVVTSGELELHRPGAAGQVVARTAVADVRVGRWRASVRADGGFPLMAVPVGRRRAEITAALVSAGWPVRR